MLTETIKKTSQDFWSAKCRDSYLENIEWLSKPVNRLQGVRAHARYLTTEERKINRENSQTRR